MCGCTAGLPNENGSVGHGQHPATAPGAGATPLTAGQHSSRTLAGRRPSRCCWARTRAHSNHTSTSKCIKHPPAGQRPWGAGKPQWMDFLFKKSVRLSTLSSILTRLFIFKQGKFSLLTLHKDDLTTESTCDEVCLHRTRQRSRPCNFLFLLFFIKMLLYKYDAIHVT